MSDSPEKLYFTRQSRDLHRLDVGIINASTGDVKVLFEERLNTYIDTKPLRLVNNQADLVFWSERDGWGHFYLYDATTGALKNRLTEGEFVTTGIENVDEKNRVMYITAAGREKGEDPYLHAPLSDRRRRNRNEAPQPRQLVTFDVGVGVGPVLRQ